MLFKLPETLYLNWVRQAPEQRAPIVAQWLLMTGSPVDNGSTWHSALERFVAEFGEIDGVLPKMARASIRLVRG